MNALMTEARINNNNNKVKKQYSDFRTVCIYFFGAFFCDSGEKR